MIIQRLKRTPSPRPIIPAGFSFLNDNIAPNALPRPLTVKRNSPGIRKEEKGEFESIDVAVPILPPEVSIRNKKPAGIAPAAMNA